MVIVNPRRRVLKAGLAASVLFAPGLARVWAQSAGTLKLLQLPKIALVIGNSDYRSAPLRNPANDARAIGAALSATGFAVNVKLDAGRAELSAAVEAYVKELDTRKCVGVFYYAGHGVQLAWKNYMLPVDANIGGVEDVQRQSVEVNALMEGLNKAGNALNVVILDACRDNPFGKAVLKERGLSQMDAPNQTLLAYATAPGNVASDGEGANGLYTENLLREIKVPEAKLEDVFKRVRLSVRLKSKGAQVPWESTSLEEDFWFIPPKELKARSEAEKEKLYNAELAVWENAQRAAGPGPLQDYLQRYPGGRFAELAQLRLEQELTRIGEKKIQIASGQGNPYTQGSATADTRFRIGDTYSHRVLDLYSRVEQSRFTETVTQISDNAVTFSNGFIVDLLGNTLRQPDGRRFSPNQNSPLEFSVGRRWISRYTISYVSGSPGLVEREFRITKREKISVPAGTFDAFLVDSFGFILGSRADGRPIEISNKRWFAPDQCRRPVAMEEIRKAGATTIAVERRELMSFKQA